MLFLERSGFPEETYHTFSYSPVYDDESRIAGMLCVVTEVTERVIGERRLRVLSDLAAHVAASSASRRAAARRATCSRAIRSTFRSPRSISSTARRASALARARRAPIGARLPRNARARRRRRSRGRSRRSSTTKRRAKCAICRARRRASRPATGPIASSARCCCRCKSFGAAGSPAFSIAGVSPRRPFDEEYRSFLDLVAGQIAAAIGDAQAYESGATPRRSARRARSREDRVLLERQPRVPHAADADAGSAARKRSATRALPARCASGSSSRSATRRGCCVSSTRCSISRASKPAACRRATSRPISPR